MATAMGAAVTAATTTDPMMASRRAPLPVLLLLLLLLLLLPCQPRAITMPRAHGSRSAPPAAQTPFSDQSAYVGLSSSGALLATGDFNNDRFADLLMLDAKSLRKVSVMQWQHHSFSFRHVGRALDVRQLHLPRAFGRVSAAYVADFGNDGRMDVLLLDGTQGVIVFGDARANFNASKPALLPEVPRVTAVVDADGDLVPELFVAFDNGTRGFYKYHRDISVQRDRFDQRGSVRFHRWDAHSTCEDGTTARVASAQSVAFADMDGDCQPDLVLGTTCSLEVWLSGARSHTPLWQLLANGSHARVFNRSLFDHDGGDHALVAADLDADGAMDIGVANRKRGDLRVHLNRQPWRAPGVLCSATDDWQLQTVQALGANELTLREQRLGSLFGAISVPPALRVGDMDLDGWPDVLTVDAATALPVVFRNQRKWARDERDGSGSRGGDNDRDDDEDDMPLRRVDARTLRALQHGNGGTVAAGWLDTDENGRQDVVVVRANETRLMWNGGGGGGQRLFFKGTVLSALGFRLQPRPFAPVVGNTVKLSYAERGASWRRRRRRRICSQGGGSGGAWTLAGSGCVFGLGAIANYVEE
ncbi:unnamed protein product, partial [Agarophyton chilense]